MSDDGQTNVTADIRRLAAAYVAAVECEPELDIWDTDDGKPADGASKSASDWSWRAHDEAKQKAFDELRAALAAAPASANDPVTTLALARQAHIDALNAYNDRVKLVRAERERGNHSMNVDIENRAMFDAQSAFIKAAQDIADAARVDLGLTAAA